MNDKTFDLARTSLFEICQKEGVEINHVNLYYTPETETLTVFCRYSSDKTWETHKIGDYKCDALTYARVLTNIIQDPKWITSNQHVPETIYVEFEDQR